MAVIGFTAIAYGPALRVPFIGDDYLFLDKTRNASFWDLWSRTNVDFGWYRPWSREFHFWTLRRIFGAHEFGFRAASLVLWLLGLGLYHRFLRRFASPPVAGLAVLGLCGLSMWGAPLTWISGAQDLWMIVFATLTLWLVARGQWPIALATYLGALLSKETAATLPLVLVAYFVWIQRARWTQAIRSALPFAVLSAGWLVFHPTLMHRLANPGAHAIGGEQPTPPHEALGSAFLNLVNLDQPLWSPDLDALRPLAILLSALVLAIAAGMLLAPKRSTPPASATGVSRADLVRFGAAWCAAGWLPLLLSSVKWHAYYGSFGVLGAWLAVAAVLADRPRQVVMLVMLLLGLTRGLAAATQSWDWGSEWYQTRAGNMLSLIRTQLLALHPTLPSRSRLYFGSIPNNIGLIAGESPAVRVWYDDPSLTSGFYSYYRPRQRKSDDGPDLFFHFDSSTGIREVHADGAPRAGADPAWEGDHERLAMTFMQGGDLPRAAVLFEAVARLPHRADAAMFAAVCWQVSGDSLRARANFAEARRRTELTPAQIDDWTSWLLKAMPRR